MTSPSPTGNSSLLRALPLVGASNLLTIGIEAFLHLRPFTTLSVDTNVTSGDGSGLAHLFAGFFYPGAVTVLSNVGLTTATAIYNWRHSPKSSRRRKWYGWTAVLSLGHLVFVPLIAGYCEEACDARGMGDSAVKVAVEGWLKIHSMRMVVDFLAMACALRAVGLD